jgi:hypothetical protein
MVRVGTSNIWRQATRSKPLTNPITDEETYRHLFPLQRRGEGASYTAFVEAHTKGRFAALPEMRAPASTLKY